MSNDNDTSTLSQRTKEWSDKTCEEISNSDKFPDYVNHLGIQKNVIKRFLDFYLGGKIPKGLNVTDLVFSVISIIPLHIKTEDTPWDKQEYGNGSLFSLLPDDIQLVKTDVIVPSIENNETLYQNKFDAIKTLSESKVNVHLNSEKIACATENHLERVEEAVDLISPSKLKHNVLKSDVHTITKLAKPKNIDDQSNSKNNVHTSTSNSEKATKSNSCPQVSNVVIDGTTENKVIGKTELNIECVLNKQTNDNVVVEKRNNKRSFLEFKYEEVDPAKICENLLARKRHKLKVKPKIVSKEYETKDQQPDNSKTVEKSIVVINKDYKNQKIEEDLISKTNSCLKINLEKDNFENDEKIKVGTFELPFDTKFLGYKTVAKIKNFKPQYYGHLQNSTLIKYCQSLLDEWHKSQQARIILKYFFGIVALTLMRGVTKSYKHLVNTFSSEKFQDYVKYINKFSNNSIFWYCIPQKRCIDHCYKTFRKRHEKTKIMLAKIVIYSIKIDKLLSYKIPKPGDPKFPESDNPFLLNIFRTTILAHTANYGLELISMVQSIANNLHIESLNIAMEIIYCKETKESHKRLLCYLNQYLDPNTNYSKKTHHWARVIDDNYFNFICCSNNYALAVILAVFTEQITLKKDIWKSKWIEKGQPENLEKFKKLGERFFKVFLKQNPNADHHIRGFTDFNVEDKAPVRFLAPRVMHIRNGEKFRLAIRGYGASDDDNKEDGPSNSSIKSAVNE